MWPLNSQFLRNMFVMTVADEVFQNKSELKLAVSAHAQLKSVQSETSQKHNGP